jgi:hypothetical protein
MREATAAEAIAEGLLDAEPEPREWTPDCEWEPTHWEMDAIHAEALDWLTEHEADIALFDAMEQELEAQEDASWDFERDEQFDDGRWMPILTMTEAREHFGRDWEHNGFHIISPNAVRRAPRQPRLKEYQMADMQTERLKALNAARAQRQQAERLAALLHTDEPAKVTRPAAEHPEPTPYEKFAGASAHYNDTLDPISPNFDLGSW